MPRSRGEVISHPQHSALPGRPPRNARGAGLCKERRCGCHHRIRYGGNQLLPQHRSGGAHLHPTFHIQRGSAQVLCPLRRCGRACKGVEPRPGQGHTRHHCARIDLRPIGATRAHRDVRPRRIVHGHQRQMLPLAAHLRRIREQGRLLPGMPPGL